jgi:hypothetical protein
MLQASIHISPENALAIVLRCCSFFFYSVRLLLVHCTCTKFNAINFISRPRIQKICHSLSLSPQCSVLRRVVNFWFFICLYRIFVPHPLNEALNKYHIRYTIMHISLFYCVQVFYLYTFFLLLPVELTERHKHVSYCFFFCVLSSTRHA